MLGLQAWVLWVLRIKASSLPAELHSLVQREYVLKRDAVSLPLAIRLLKKINQKELKFPQGFHAGRKARLKLGGEDNFAWQKRNLLLRKRLDMSYQTTLQDREELETINDGRNCPMTKIAQSYTASFYRKLILMSTP